MLIVVLLYLPLTLSLVLKIFCSRSPSLVVAFHTSDCCIYPTPQVSPMSTLLYSLLYYSQVTVSLPPAPPLPTALLCAATTAVIMSLSLCPSLW